MTPQEMHDWLCELYPLCRSLTGPGTLETLRQIAERVSLHITSVPSGTNVLGWDVPYEWTPREAWIETPAGERIADFSQYNLHLNNYSKSVDAVMTLEELRPHLSSLPEHPDWIPYRYDFYWKRGWGFCLPHRQVMALQPGQYKVHIDADLKPGHLNYGQCVIPGETDETILLSTYVCHPSLCNDNLSGPVVLTALAQRLLKESRRYTYRIVFVPEVIGAIAWLSHNDAKNMRVVGGLVVTCCGDDGPITYKRSKQGTSMFDRIVENVLAWRGPEFTAIDWHPNGSDERQYCSPGLNWPVGCLMRTPPAMFSEYHTSADDCEFVTAGKLGDSLEACWQIVCAMEANETYKTVQPVGEGYLGSAYAPTLSERLLQGWVLALSDGGTSVLDIAERTGLPMNDIAEAATLLYNQGMVTKEG